MVYPVLEDAPAQIQILYLTTEDEPTPYKLPYSVCCKALVLDIYVASFIV